MTFLQNAGLSHSEIFGSKVICTYPKLIAAYHVLHRLREPRHPPCALIYFLLSPGSSPFLKKDLNQMVRYILLALTKFTFFCTSCQRSYDNIQQLALPAYQWWRITDSNRWPSACKADALASWANPPRGYQELLSFLSLVVPGRVELPTSTLSV